MSEFSSCLKRIDTSEINHENNYRLTFNREFTVGTVPHQQRVSLRVLKSTRLQVKWQRELLV